MPVFSSIRLFGTHRVTDSLPLDPLLTMEDDILKLIDAKVSDGITRAIYHNMVNSVYALMKSGPQDKVVDLYRSQCQAVVNSMVTTILAEISRQSPGATVALAPCQILATTSAATNATTNTTGTRLNPLIASGDFEDLEDLVNPFASSQASPVKSGLEMKDMIAPNMTRV